MRGSVCGGIKGKCRDGVCRRCVRIRQRLEHHPDLTLTEAWAGEWCDMFPLAEAYHSVMVAERTAEIRSRRLQERLALG